MSTTQQQPNTEKSQQDYLQDAKDAVNRGHPHYARQVIYLWCSLMDVPAPFRVNQNPDAQPDFCADCSTGDTPVKAVFYWDLFGSLCGECSLARFDCDGSNPRIGEDAERRGR